MLRVFLFGAPRIELNGQIVPLRRSKALALLAYLATTRQPQDREAPLALLWPEFDAASARNNLRRELSLLKTVLGEHVLVADRLQIAWSPQVDAWLDVAAFQAHLAVWRQHRHPIDALCAECAATLETAVQLYREDFLAGFGLSDSPSFDEWQFFVREGLRQQLAQALQALSGWYSRGGAYDAAVDSTRRWLALDPLHEVAQRELMRLYVWAGQHAAALRQYEECVRLLDAELGAEPEPETTELYKAIKARRLASPAVTAEPAPVVAATLTIPASEPRLPARHQQPPFHNLPLPLAGFVGRQRELADLLRRLTDPDCHLLTLVGPGGIGKTRLALRAAQILAEEWISDDGLADGVLFVPLSAVDTSSGLVSALAAAARFDFYPNVPPNQQLLDYFRTKHMLVILDNFEQLLDAGQFIGELIAAAPGLRLLITSRVALNRHDEWFHPIDGLAFPAADDDVSGVAQLARYDAVRLFEQHARRVRSDFSLSRARAPIVHLCRLVEGMPLAIELAASWLKVLSVEQVVAALERGLDILTTRDKQIPERHRSIRAVLEESWRLLSADEQRMFATLAVFRGGFSAEAAESIAGASLEMLATLVDKSLLRSGADGRFQLHELLCQFARKKLTTVHEEALARQQHSIYYLSLLCTWGNAFARGDQQVGPTDISRDIENIRAAWARAVAQCDIDTIEQVLEPLFDLYQNRGRYQEGHADFASAVATILASDALAAHPRHKQLDARLLARQGTFCYYLGDHSAASRHLEASLQTAQTLALKNEEAFALSFLGQVSTWRGDYGVAKQQLLQSLAISRELDDKSGTATALEKLAEVMSDLGAYQEAQQLSLESLAVSRELGRPDRIAHAHGRLGYVMFRLGKYHEATIYYRESLTIFDSLDHQLGKALSLGGVALVKSASGGAEVAEAKAYFEQSLALLRKIGHQQHIAERLIDLSQLASDSGEYVQAHHYAQEALAIAQRLGSLIHVSFCLSCLGRAACELQDFQTSRAYLVEALEIASPAHISIADIKALFDAAVLLVKESAHADRDEPARIQKALWILELLEIVIHHPATWHLVQVRARRLSEQLRRDLPAELVAAAIARGQQFDWQMCVAVLIDELAGSPPAESSGAVNQLAPPPTTSFAA